VGCLQTVAQMLLPRLRRSFSDQYPEVVFAQAEGHQADLFAALRSGKMDLALTYELEVPPDLRFTPLVALPPHVLLDAGHPLASKSRIAPAELVDLPMVLLDLPFSGDYFLSIFSRRGLKPQIAERTRDMGLMRAMVANGFGYSIANIRLKPDVAPDGAPLCAVPLEDPENPVVPLMFGILLPEGALAARRVRAFVDHCHSEVPGVIGC
jgi:DNA-binding transcriptional LysR family regulator